MCKEKALGDSALPRKSIIIVILYCRFFLHHTQYTIQDLAQPFSLALLKPSFAFFSSPLLCLVSSCFQSSSFRSRSTLISVLFVCMHGKFYAKRNDKLFCQSPGSFHARLKAMVSFFLCMCTYSMHTHSIRIQPRNRCAFNLICRWHLRLRNIAIA